MQYKAKYVEESISSGAIDGGTQRIAFYPIEYISEREQKQALKINMFIYFSMSCQFFFIFVPHLLPVNPVRSVC